MSSLSDVLTTIASQIVTAINDAGITASGQVGAGWPNYEDLTKIINANQWQVSLYTKNAGTRNTSRFLSKPGILNPSSTSLAAAISGNVITFTGSVPTSGANIHALFGNPLTDSLAQVSSGTSLDDVASAVAEAVNDAGGTAVASGATVAVTTTALKCNVGSNALLAQESLRVCRDVQVTAWCPDPDTRASLSSAIVGAIGTQLAPRITLPDGSTAWVRYQNDYWNDERELDFSMYVAYAFFQVEYASYATFDATPIGAWELTVKTPGETLTSEEG